MKTGLIYKDQNGEYFESVDHNGLVCLANPSYPFVFDPGIMGKLELIGSAEKHRGLLEKKDYQFHEGETLTVKVNDNNLEVVEDSV